MLAAVFAEYEPGRVVLLADDGINEKFLAQSLLFINDMEMIDEKATAYVCQDFTCQMPVNSVEELKLQIKRKVPETPTK